MYLPRPWGCWFYWILSPLRSRCACWMTERCLGILLISLGIGPVVAVSPQWVFSDGYWLGVGPWLNNMTEDFGAEINKELEFWLLWSTRLGYQHSRPAWPVMSVSACQQCTCWIATMTVWSLAGRRCLLSYTLILHLWSKYWLVFLLDNSIAIALWPGELWSVDLR